MGKRNAKVINNTSAGNPSGKPIDVYGFSLAQISRGVRVHNSTLSRIFSGKRRVSLQLAARICAFTGITLERLNRDLYLTPRARIARKHRVPL